MKKISNSVLTGGPCGGKTTYLAYTPHKLRTLGDKVYVIPETATTLINAGFDPRDKNFQKEVLKYQLQQEEFFRQKAHSDSAEQIIIFHDRGIMDGRAYVSEEVFMEALSACGLSLSDMHRYDNVIHLVSAAIGASEFYSTANNAARRESPEEAAAQEKLALKAWLEHGKVDVINNIGVTFEEKIEKAYAALLDALGRPVPIEREKKYKCIKINLAHILNKEGIDWRKIKIEQDYLRVSDINLERRVRKVIYGDGSTAFFYTEKVPHDVGARIERERTLKSDEYHRFLLAEREDNSQTIKKSRIAFIADDRYFEFDTFTDPAKEHCLLEVKPTITNPSENLPSFLGDVVLEDVTEDASYYGKNIAARNN